jgi:peptide/nickel transport system permease protein
MPRFLARRVGLGLFVMFAVTLIVFAIFFVGPGPQYVAQRLAGRQATPEIVSAVRHRLLLDKPTYLQYWHFLKQLVWHRDLGY